MELIMTGTWTKENNQPSKDSGHLISDESHRLFAEYLYNEKIKYIL